MADPSSPINRDTWARINDLFHRALDRPAPDRAAFLDEMCGTDARLRGEVESLLAAHAQADDFIERPTMSVASMLNQSGTVPLPEHIGQYRILRLLGEGGMGVVYLAEDMRLGRTVALKSLAPRFVGDATRRERLRREARAAASLNHPGIATVYALEEIDEHLYIAGEYVPGETLRDEIARGPLEPLLAIDTTLRIAQALSMAHQRGIVHRDLKPENVMRLPGGELKILDFGLARFRDLSPSDVVLSGDGAILGTPAYMSPEQIRGASVDARSDIFSLGVMLYEFLTGVHPFSGSDPASTIARILEAEPVRLIEQLPRDVPPSALGQLELTVLTCLRKSAEGRFASAADLVTALERTRDAWTARRSGVGVALSGGYVADQPGVAWWWWQFHQAATVAVYSLLVIPLWFMRGALPPAYVPFWRFLFLAGLVGVIVASALRLHLWFAVRLDPSGWPRLHQRSRLWQRVGDLLFVAALVVSGFLVLEGDKNWLGVVLVAAAAAVAVSFAIIEPTTTQAAFRDGAEKLRT